MIIFLLAIKLGQVFCYVDMKTNLLISNPTNEFHALCETFKGNQVHGKQTSTVRIWTRGGKNAS